MQEKHSRASIYDTALYLLRGGHTRHRQSVAMTDPKHIITRGGNYCKEVFEATKGCIRSKLIKLLLQASASSFNIKETAPASTTHPVPISSFLGHIKKFKKKKNNSNCTNRIEQAKMFNFWCGNLRCLMHFFKENF